VWRNHLCAVIGSLSCSSASRQQPIGQRPIDEMIARQAEIHGGARNGL
jgi:hypothetical protein